MAKVGAQRAAELTGRSKSTIQRAMNAGKLSYEVDSNGRRVIDVSELDRAFGLAPQGVGAGQMNLITDLSVEAELKKTTDLLEMERMKMRIKMLEAQLESAEDQLEDAKSQRDQWQKQATQVLLTSQYSQKQAEDLKAEIDARDRRARMRRQQVMKQAASVKQSATAARKSGLDFSNLWQKIRGEKTVAANAATADHAVDAVDAVDVEKARAA